MSAAIAIDFGTSRTKLAYLDDATGRPELMRLGQRDDPFIPSLFYLERDSERIFLGDDAEAMLEQDPAGIVEVLKRKLHEAYVRANRRRIAPQDLLGLLLAELRTRSGLEVASFRGQLAPAVHLTVPAIYGPAQERILRAAAEQAGFSEIVLVPEPVSAARAWLAQAHTTTPGVVVFDGGGGTIDWAYLRRDGTDFSLVPECPPGGDRVGGHDLDRELLARVEDRLDSGALADGHGHEQAALQAVRVLKERYCRGLPCQPVRIGTCAVRLTAAEIDDAFEARFIRHACEGLKGYLAQVREVSGPDQPPVLLVGGSARIKGLREAIERDCGCETIWWERADYATVLGAVSRHRDGLRVAVPFSSDGITCEEAEAYDGYADVLGAVSIGDGADVRESAFDFDQESWSKFIALPRGGCELSPEEPIATEEVQQHAPSDLISGRYRDHGDGTVTDVETGLQWMRCALGQSWNAGKCLGKATGYSWYAALETAEKLNQHDGYAKLRDWRLPTIEELKTLIYCSNGRRKDWKGTGSPCEGEFTTPTIDRLAFPEIPKGWFWSSSPLANGSSYAWGLSFGLGRVGNDYKSYTRYVRLVRGGQ